MSDVARFKPANRHGVPITRILSTQRILRAGLLGTLVVIVCLAAVINSALAKGKTLPSQPLDGIVKSSDGLVPSGAQVIATHVSGSTRSTACDGQGQFSLAEMPLGKWVLRAERIGYSGSEVSIEIGSQRPPPIALMLTWTGVRYVGRVVDDRGTPIAGAQILVTVPVPPRRTWADLGVERPKVALSTSDGAFEVQCLKAGPLYVLHVRHPHYANAAVQSLPCTPGTVNERIVVTLAAASWIQGRVTTRDGKPLSGASVGHAEDGTLIARPVFRSDGRRMETSEWADRLPTVTTSALGEFLIGGIAGGEVEIVVDADDYFVGHRHIDGLKSGIGYEGIAIELEEATASVVGRVVNANGTAMPGTAITATGDVGIAGMTMTDREGVFAFRHLRSHRAVRLEAIAPHYAASTAEGVELDRDDVRVVLEQAPILRFDVKRPDGSPMDMIKVTFRNARVGAGPMIKDMEAERRARGFSTEAPIGLYLVELVAAGFDVVSLGVMELKAGEARDLGTVSLVQEKRK